jgi:pimeloyl-ACP methyl ester carboxylesterase
MRTKKIYILHGWAYTIDKWDPLVSELKKHDIEAIMLKIPGLTAPLEEVWDLDNYVAWLAELLESETRVTLLGHSNGGRISLAYAAKYPEKVEKLLLIDSAGIYHNELPIKLKRIIFGRLAKFGKVFTKSKNLRALLYKFSREHDYEKADPIVRQTMHNLIRTDLRDILSTIVTPTTIIWGENDKITPVGDGNIMSEKLQNASLNIISDARHSPQFTHVKEVTALIIKNL